ncbi:hypothetical protein M1L60_09175 [Actinoplanes sp. TRM 88003]|uniref:Uncharacterized protein n=1 Tax=Paractinoplanes aksuensis TaxID=2939490 RepID=A0ABT1DIY5_9ACTN|nr:hypothetical protein [Actinoplanes aksuensis]MCO8270765.1 hypothetical protein [Actinoplanes aksuensis]
MPIKGDPGERPPDTFVTFVPDERDPSWDGVWDPEVELPPAVFLWRYFQVRVTFRMGGVDLSQSMDSIPVSVLISP